MSPKHLDRYVSEFLGRHNARGLAAVGQMKTMITGMVGKRLRYEELMADNNGWPKS